MTMKRTVKSVYGATLLEIMLVLAIAAMIIVMSVRYYQSAQVSSQANAFVAQVQAVTSAVESIAQGTGNYSTITSAQVTQVLPANGLIAPWGGTITFAATTTGFTLTVPQPSVATCTLARAKLTTSTQFTVVAPCTTVTYVANQ
jgi:type II secretory pathway pseudopilin PulG